MKKDHDRRPRSLLPEAATRELLAILSHQSDFDVRAYKLKTITRRVERRMALARVNDIERYLELLGANPPEQEALRRDLLIGVTEFFRDPAAFEALRTLVVEPLVQAATAEEPIRVWVPACSTGEEAYSVAMLFLEAIEERKIDTTIQLFATDADQAAIVTARAGLYPSSIATHVSARRLERFFVPRDSGYRLKPVLRDVVSFASHDLAKDPPLSRMHLLSCRNVLIYLRPEAQEHVRKLLHFALRPEGYLFLGMSESTGAQRHLFSTLSKKWRIYRKVGSSSRLVMNRKTDPTKTSTSATSSATSEASPTQVSGRANDRGDAGLAAVLSACLPPAVVVSAGGDVVLMHGELRPYFHFPQGEPRLDLSALVTPELATRVRAAFYRCRRDRERVIAYSSPDSNRAVRTKITATPAPTVGEGAVILTFEDLETSPATEVPTPEHPEQEALIDQLENELRATREDLCNTVEELELSNEELRASHEESMSMNEELQSANEELEAATEELRSLNEELTTVNTQLREKVDEIELAHDDLSNFFVSARIATVFLDEELRVKRFTPAAQDLLRIGPSDEGRFIGDIARELLQHDLIAEAKSVLDDLRTRDREITTPEGRWIARRVLPYQTENRRIAGVVVTLIDITDLKNTSERLAHRERQQSCIASLGIRALEEQKLEEFLQHAAREVQQILETDYCGILELQPGGRQLFLRAGVGWRDGSVGTATVPASLDSHEGFTLTSPAPVITSRTTELRFPRSSHLIEHGVESGLSCTIRERGEPYGVLSTYTRSPRSFSLSDSDFLQSAAGVIARAISISQSRIRRELEATTGKALADADSVEDVVASIHSVFAAEFGPTIAELWWPNEEPKSDCLTCSFVATTPNHPEHVVRAEFSQGEIGRGDGLVGRVWESGRAECITVPCDRSLLGRFDAANKLGLVMGLALPVLTRSKVLGVVSLFTMHRVIVDDLLLRSLEAIGRSLGELLRRFEAEQVAREGEARKAAILDASLDGVITIDHQGRIIEFNETAQEIFGYGAEAVGQEMADLLIPPDVRREHHKGMARLLTTGESHILGKRLELNGLRSDGSTVPIELTVTKINQSGRPLFTAFVRDITEHKRAQERLQESERRFRNTFDHAPTGIAHVSLDGRWMLVNDRLLEITGYERDELQHKSFAELTYRDDFSRNEDQMEALRNGNIDSYQLEKRYIRKDGSLIWASLTVSLSLTPEGKADYYIAIIEDIEDRKEAERQQVELAAIVASSDDAILSKDLRGIIQSWNPGAERLYGYDPEEVIGRSVTVIIPEERQGELRTIMTKVARGEPVENHETVRQRKDGTRIDVSVTVSPLKTKDGRIVGASSIARDIGRRKRVEAKLREASRQKDEFLAMLGHELRNPLAAISTAAQLLKTVETDDPLFQKTHAMLNRQTHRMAKLLDGLLDVSRIIRGKITLEHKPVDLVTIVQDVLEDAAPRINARDLVLHRALPETPAVVEGDPVRLAQVIDNLLSNAIKFTDPPGVISVSLTSDRDSAVLRVRDSGRGIAPDLLDHIFEAFRQGPQELSRTSGGLGLGLALVKALVERHQGSVEVQSAGLDHGTEFTVRLPLLRAELVTSDQETELTTGNQRILVVEDDADLASTLQDLLKAVGHKVWIASNGQEALLKVDEIKPDVVLCDLGLPGDLNGFDVARQIRSQSRFDQVLLAAVSGYGRPEDKARSRESGFDLHLTKPIDLNVLESTLLEYGSRPQN